ncbi:MAG: hypothetical protein ACSHYA_18625 [Opitutaceae bacterium]
MKNTLSGILGSVYIFLLGLVIWAIFMGVLAFTYAGAVSRSGDSPTYFFDPVLVYPVTFAIAALVIGRTKPGKNHVCWSPLAYILFIGSSLPLSFDPPDPPDPQRSQIIEVVTLLSPIILIPTAYGVGRKVRSQSIEP